MTREQKRVFKDRVMKLLDEQLQIPGLGVQRVSYQTGDNFMLLTVRDNNGYPNNFEVRISEKW